MQWERRATNGARKYNAYVYVKDSLGDETDESMAEIYRAIEQLLLCTIALRKIRFHSRKCSSKLHVRPSHFLFFSTIVKTKFPVETKVKYKMIFQRRARWPSG